MPYYAYGCALVLAHSTWIFHCSLACIAFRLFWWSAASRLFGDQNLCKQSDAPSYIIHNIVRNGCVWPPSAAGYSLHRLSLLKLKCIDTPHNSTSIELLWLPPRSSPCSPPISVERWFVLSPSDALSAILACSHHPSRLLQPHCWSDTPTASSSLPRCTYPVRPWII